MTTTKKKSRKSDAMRFLDKLIGKPLTFGGMLQTIRETDGHTLAAMAKKLGVTRGHICDIEKGRRGVSPARAAKWAKVLGYPAALFVQLALQAQVDEAGLGYRIEVKAA
jgi:antitoxin HigA-1